MIKLQNALIKPLQSLYVSVLRVTVFIGIYHFVVGKLKLTTRHVFVSVIQAL
jgi:hypothetical protein